MDVPMGEPRKIGEILNPALARLDTTDQARAYGLWTRAAGDTVAANARPRSFARGVLTVECASSIWAQELTYLGGQLLARMSELDPAHPVQRLRFVTRHSPAPPPDPSSSPEPPPPPPGPSGEPATGSPTQEEEPVASNESKRDGTIDRADLAAAQAGAREVGDERLREAIRAALDAAADGSAQGPPSGSSVNQKK
jgi:type IV secretory pathway VirB10-like protein